MSDSDALSRVFEGTGLVLLGTVFNLAAEFASRAVAANALGPGEYGHLSLALSLITVAAVLSRIGLDEGVARYLPRLDEGAQQTVAFTSLGLSLLASLFLGGVSSSCQTCSPPGYSTLPVSRGCFGGSGFWFHSWR